VAPSTVQRHVERLGRHCLLLHERLRPRKAPRETLVLDGFRALESGRYWPFDLNLVVGRSHFVYGISDAELRRSGRMTAHQLRRRAELEARYGRPDPRATRRSVGELLERTVPEGSSVELRTDEHPAYRGALNGLHGRAVVHRTTSSRAPRTPRSALYPANLADLLLRHCGANHKRQTIALSKRRQGALYRAMIWLVWRNYVQWSCERRRSAPPGVGIGAIPRRLVAGEVIAERLFPWRHELRGWVRRVYFARIPTRCLKRIRTHQLRYAV
jgi:hypothetical protein